MTLTEDLTLFWFAVPSQMNTNQSFDSEKVRKMRNFDNV